LLALWVIPERLRFPPRARCARRFRAWFGGNPFAYSIRFLALHLVEIIEFCIRQQFRMIEQIRAPPFLQLHFVNASASQKFPPAVVSPESSRTLKEPIALGDCEQFGAVRFVIYPASVIVWIRGAEIIGITQRPEVKELREWNLVDAPSFC
jgi:hypothetical protein